MSGYQMTFRRYELKYLLNESTYRFLRERLEEKMQEDQYGETAVCSIYFDTPDVRLIRESLEKPVYKEKLRLRSYGVPDPGSEVFVELKKKYKGVVYTIRAQMVLSEAWEYLCSRRRPGFDSQILREIDWILSYYGNLAPAMYLSCERTAMCGREETELRITFDRQIRWRDSQLKLSRGVWGKEILEPGQRLMEIKVANAMPLWLTELLDQFKIYPVSFSKYGRAYQEQLIQKAEIKGGQNCA